MFNWKSTVRLASGYLKEVMLNDYNTAEDATAAARGQTGGGDVLITERWQEASQPTRQVQPVPWNNKSDDKSDEVDAEYMDDLEEQMYMYHCERAIRLGKEPPTVDEFYDWLEYRFK